MGARNLLIFILIGVSFESLMAKVESPSECADAFDLLDQTQSFRWRPDLRTEEHEQVLELHRFYQMTQDRGALSELLFVYEPYVKMLVKKRKKKGGLPSHVSFDEAVQAGLKALPGLLERYEIEKNISFTTYARQRIEGAIVDLLRSTSDQSRIFVQKRKSLEELEDSFFKQNGFRPSTEELIDFAQSLDYSQSEIDDLLANQKESLHPELSADRDWNDDTKDRRSFDQSFEKLTSLSDPTDQDLIPDEKRILWEAIRQKFPSKLHRQILWYRLQLGYSLKQTGEAIDKSESRVSQIQDREILPVLIPLAKQLELSDVLTLSSTNRSLKETYLDEVLLEIARKEKFINLEEIKSISKKYGFVLYPSMDRDLRQLQPLYRNREEAVVEILEVSRQRGIDFVVSDPSLQPLDAPEIREVTHEEILQTLFDWVKKNKRLPERRDFGKAEDKLHFEAAKIFGTGAYADGQKYESRRVFASQQEALATLSEMARSEGVSIRPINPFFKEALSPTLQKEMQIQATEIILDWIKKNDRFPSHADFGSKRGQIPLDYERTFGLAHYRDGEPLSGRAVFSDAQSGILQIYNAARTQNIPFKLIDLSFNDELDPKIRTILQNEVTEMVLDWIKENHRWPGPKDFGPNEGQIPLGAFRVLGMGAYKKGEPQEGLAIFPGSQAAALHFFEAASGEGLPLRLSAYYLKGSYSADFRDALQDEVSEMILDWTKDHQRFPNVSDFGNRQGLVPLNYGKVFGVQAHAPGKAQAGQAIFSDRQAALAHFRQTAQSQGIDPDLIPPK